MLKHLLRLNIVIVLFFSLVGCAKIGSADIGAVLENISRTLPSVWRLLTAFAYLAGFSFVMKGIFKLKIYGEMRTMMSSHTDLKGPMIFIFIGVALIYSPTTFGVLMQTAFGSSNPIAYVNTGPITFSGFDALLKIIQVVGLISFIRGWIQLSHTVNQGGGQNAFGKGLTHIIGGVLAINIGGTIEVLQNTILGI